LFDETKAKCLGKMIRSVSLAGGTRRRRSVVENVPIEDAVSARALFSSQAKS